MAEMLTGKDRPYRYTGQITFDIPGQTGFPVTEYATGGRNRGSAPFGSYPISGYTGNSPDYGLKGYALNNIYGNMPDQKYPDAPRSGIMIHLATGGQTLEQLYSSGCLVIPPSQFPAFRDAVNKLQAQGVGLAARLASDGRVTIVQDPRGYTSSKQMNEPSLKEFITQATLVQSGASGARIEDVQTFLKGQGFDPGKVDGQFGGQTTNAVKAFQRANGLDADGVIGRQTMAAMTSQGFGNVVDGPGRMSAEYVKPGSNAAPVATASGPTMDKASAIAAKAVEIGANPVDLARAISYETIGTFDPGKWGGAGGNYLGLIQFGPNERKTYGVSAGQTFQQQLDAAGRFLQDRGFKPGMGLAEMYAIINHGSLGPDGQPRWDRRDQNGSLREHVARMQSGAYDNEVVTASRTAQPGQPAYGVDYQPQKFDVAALSSSLEALGLPPVPQAVAVAYTENAQAPARTAFAEEPPVTPAAEAATAQATQAPIVEASAAIPAPQAAPVAMPKSVYGMDKVFDAAVKGDALAFTKAVMDAKGAMDRDKKGGVTDAYIKRQIDNYVAGVKAADPTRANTAISNITVADAPLLKPLAAMGALVGMKPPEMRQQLIDMVGEPIKAAPPSPLKPAAQVTVEPPQPAAVPVSAPYSEARAPWASRIDFGSIQAASQRAAGRPVTAENPWGGSNFIPVDQPKTLGPALLDANAYKDALSGMKTNLKTGFTAQDVLQPNAPAQTINPAWEQWSRDMAFGRATGPEPQKYLNANQQAAPAVVPPKAPLAITVNATPRKASTGSIASFSGIPTPIARTASIFPGAGALNVPLGAVYRAPTATYNPATGGVNYGASGGSPYAYTVGPNGQTTYQTQSGTTWTIDTNNQGPGSATASKVLCTHYCRIGWLPKDVWKADIRYSTECVSPLVQSGYLWWAEPLVEYLKRGSMVAKAIQYAAWPVVRGWAHEMAHRADPGRFPTGSMIGHLVTVTLEPLCGVLGLLRNAIRTMEAQ